MRRIICILMCLSMASMVSALSITNGDFEALGIRNDVPDWSDGGDAYIRLLYSPNGTQYMGLRTEDSWAYQSIGVNTGGESALQIQYEIGGLDLEISPNNENPPSPATELNLTISLYESDGSFESADGDDVDGADGITRVDSVKVSYPRPENGEFITRSVVLQYLNLTSGELFLRFENTGDGDDDTEDRFSIDNVQIVGLAPSIVSPLPKDGTKRVATELTSSENDLVFSVADEDIVSVDVLFAPNDPNFSSSDKIADLSVSSGNQYTVDLEGEVTGDLEYDTNYYWKVLAYEPNGLELSVKYESPIWTFKTIQYGPDLGEVDPNRLYVYPGEDAVFSVVEYSKADTFQWYKEGDPDVALSDSDPKYTGVLTDTLTIVNAQLADEGTYYCIGKETATGETDQSDTTGRLKIKRLMTYYPFEDTIEEGGAIYTPDVVSGKNMQLFGGASLSDTDSIIGKNLWLDNPHNQYGIIADTAVADYEDITISFWCNATTLVNTTDGDRWARIFDFGKDSTEYYFFTMLYRHDDARQNGLDVARCEFRYFDDKNQSQNPELDVEDPNIDPGVWFFVAITIKANDNGSGAIGHIYLSGQHGTEAESAQILNVPRSVDIDQPKHYIGKNIGFSAPLFNGRIDDFKIYNYVRTSEEIAQDYRDVVGDVSLCDYEHYDLYEWDYDKNCQVDLLDFAEIASKWLLNYKVFPN